MHCLKLCKTRLGTLKWDNCNVETEKKDAFFCNKWILGLWLWAWFMCRSVTQILTTSGTILATWIITTPMPWSQLKHTAAWRTTAIFWMESAVQCRVMSSLQKCTRRWETSILIASTQMHAFTIIPKICNHCGLERTRWVHHVSCYNLVYRVKSDASNCSGGTSEGVLVKFPLIQKLDEGGRVAALRYLDQNLYKEYHFFVHIIVL
jgi:hypothetical protein